MVAITHDSRHQTLDRRNQMKAAELTVAAGVVRALMDLAVAKGASSRELAARSGFAPADLEDREGRIPFRSYVALMRAGKELSHDPALALHFGEAVDAEELSIATVIGGTSKNLADGLAQMNRFSPLTVEVDRPGTDRFRFAQREGRLWMIDTRPNPNDFPEMTESTFARMICTLRRTMGEPHLVKRIHVTHPAPPYVAEYDRIFRLPVVFGTPENALQIDEAMLSQVKPSISRYVSEILKAHAEKLLERLERSRTTRGRVESLLMAHLHTGGATMSTIATKLGLSRQTLSRRLRGEGVTFEEVLEKLRSTMAQEHLRQGKATVAETAYLLGFADPASFSRAFKRWMGQSPRTFRNADPGDDAETSQ